ncbi:hypothetical protein F4677DRAFT_424898 [Hypoxylon crocopeplum]|nr:hypothetical protein F4677DRAFT_424898 [Hypoxylon crocopeplum]
MPSRRSFPTLSIFSRQSTSTASTSLAPPSTRTTSVPITPPARLYLRNLLASTPDGMPTPPPPPRQPYPWLWQCHSCNTVYRMGCTRRCLICSHEFCVSVDPSPKNRRGKRRRRASGVCASEFDYNGWEEWGAWRRKVLGLGVVGQTEKRQRERAFAERTHNCITDCDYPSECHHERYRIHIEALQRNLLELIPEEPQSPSIVANASLSPDDDLVLNEALRVREDEEHDGQSPTSPRSPLSQTSFFWEESDQEEETSVWWIDNKEQEKKSKNKSRRKGRQLTGTGPSAVNPGDMDSEEQYSSSEEDERPRCQSRLSNREHPKHSGKLTVRNFTDADKWDDYDESDSDCDSNSSASSSSSSTSFDGEWIPASEATSTPVGSNKAENGLTDEEQQEESRALIEAGNSYEPDIRNNNMVNWS